MVLDWFFGNRCAEGEFQRNLETSSGFEYRSGECG